MRILRIDDVQQRTGLSKTTIWRLEQRGEFPARRQLGPNAVGWLEDEVDDWIQSRPQATLNNSDTPSQRDTPHPGAVDD